MKTMRKFMALVLTLAMALTLAIPAFATGGAGAGAGSGGDSTTPTITAPTGTNHQYAIYQIMTGTLDPDDANKLVDAKWGKNVNSPYTEGNSVPGDVMEELEDAATATSITDKGQLNVIEKYVDLTGTPIAKIGAGAGTDGATLTEVSVEPGYYLIKDLGVWDADDKKVVSPAATDAADDSYSLNIVAVVNDLTITPKTGVPSVTKKIVEGSDLVEKNDAAIGDTVSYQFTGTMPDQIENYNTYYYKFTDTLSKGLTYTANTLKVSAYQLDKDGKIDTTTKTDVTAYFYRYANKITTGDDAGKTIITVSIKDVKALSKLDPSVTVNKDTVFVITYDATLNENAVVGGTDGNPNTVYLTYSNNPNNSGTPANDAPDPSTKDNNDKPDPNNDNKDPKDEPDIPTGDDGESTPTGETPKATVSTYCTGLTITKTDADENKLANATFELKGEGLNTELQVRYTTDYEEIAADDNYTGVPYYLLNDGTYTTEAPTDANESAYASTTVKYKYTETKTVQNVVTSYEEADDGLYIKIVDEYKLVSSLTADEQAAQASNKDRYNQKESVTLTTGADGVISFSGFGEGTYTLTETNAPTGYNAVDPITFIVTFDEKTGEFTVDGVDIANNLLNTTIVNYTGNELPSTGGIGTTIFYAVGAVLVIGAGVLFITKKRMSGAED